MWVVFVAMISPSWLMYLLFGAASKIAAQGAPRRALAGFRAGAVGHDRRAARRAGASITGGSAATEDMAQSRRLA